MLGTYLKGAKETGYVALLFFGGQHELFQPEVTWSGAAEYQRLSDGGDVRHPYARCYREAMKVTMHVKFRENSLDINMFPT